MLGLATKNGVSFSAAFIDFNATTHLENIKNEHRRAMPNKTCACSTILHSFVPSSLKKNVIVTRVYFVTAFG